MDYSEKLKILVTGASRGLGKSLALALFNRGHVVYGTSTTIEESDYTHKMFKVNFTDKEQIEAFAERISSLDIDVLVNNAGINIVRNFQDITKENWNDQYLVNLYAPFRLSQACIPHMLQRGGSIINVASVWSKISKTGRAAYSSNKAALVGMTQSMAAEFSQFNIKVNCVSPGFVDTDLTRKNLGDSGIAKILEHVPANRLASSDEVTKLMLWLIESNTYITGQNISIDGGFTCV